MSPPGMPRPVRWLLAKLLADQLRDCVLGDLEEEYRLRADRRGRLRATLWCYGEAVRSAWPLMWTASGRREETTTGLTQDLRGALRVFALRPGFAAVVVITLAIGIGGTATVFSVLRGVVLTPLEFPNAERVVVLWGRSAEYPRTPLTAGDFKELTRRVEAFEVVAASWSGSTLLLGGDVGEGVSVGWVTPGWFDGLGITPAEGRLFEADDENAVILSHDLWARRYGADPEVVGRVIDLADGPVTVVAVLPDDVNANLTAFSGARTDHDLWRLQPRAWLEGDDRSVGWLRSMALLRDGVTVEQAQQEVDALMTRVNATVTDRDGGTDLQVELISAQDDLVTGISRTLWILLGAVCGVLLVAAANVAHLMLARAEEREAEVAVRSALGGSRYRLMRQFLVESGVLAGAGGLLGVGIAALGVPVLLTWAPAELPRIETVRVDPAVVLFGLAATVASVVVFGLAPAVRSARSSPAGAMAQRQATMDPSGQRLSRTLVVLQVALSLTLVTGTGLLLRSLTHLQGADLGFETENLLTFDLQVPDWGPGNEAAAARLRAFERRLEEISGVRSVGFTNRVPLAGGIYTGVFASEAMAGRGRELEASFRIVSPGYLQTLGARLVSGRDLAFDDGRSGVVLDEAAAELAWPDENPVGRRVRLSSVGGPAEWGEVVGIVAPMRHERVDRAPVPTLYVSMSARADEVNFHYAVVRTAGEPIALLEPIRGALRGLDTYAVAASPRTMRAFFDEQVAVPRFGTLLLFLFGLTALVLATVGLHGVMAYRMERRRREMGIRMALGAAPHGMLRSAFFSGAVLVGAGIVTGTAMTLWGLGPILESVLVEVETDDPRTLVGSAVVILVVGLIGAYVPARMALRVDPIRALREG